MIYRYRDRVVFCLTLDVFVEGDGTLKMVLRNGDVVLKIVPGVCKGIWYVNSWTYGSSWNSNKMSIWRRILRTM